MCVCLPCLCVAFKKLSRRHRSLLGRRFWGLNFGRRTGPYQMASTVPRLRGAVELLLTGDQHKPWASFNQHACKNTTSVAKGKWESPQKIASKCAKISKKYHRFGVRKLTRFGARLRVRILFSNKCMKNEPQNGGIIWTPKRVNLGTPKWSKNSRILMQFFAGFCACLLLRMLYSYIETGAWLALVARQ